MTKFPGICLKVGSDYQFVFPSEIIHIHSEGSYSVLTITGNKQLVVSKKLKEIIALLPTDIFVRVHHCYAVNLMYLQSFEKGANSQLVLTNGDVIKMSRRKKSDFMERFTLL
jgi:two-component system LytT family response regulator